MLVLTRKLGQAIRIGDPKVQDEAETIEVVVAEIRGDQVRLGITAASDMEIHRTEVWLDIQENGRNRIA